jgi:hypothetical protein
MTNRILFSLLLCIGLHQNARAQTSKSTAFSALDNAKEGTMIVVLETYANNIAAIDRLLVTEKEPKARERLLEQKEAKLRFREIYANSAREAFAENYTFGKYQLVDDTDLKSVRDSLYGINESYLILIHKYGVREFDVLNSNNQTVPKPFPRTFEGPLANVKNKLKNINEEQEAYTAFFVDSVLRLDYKLQRLYTKYQIKNKSSKSGK